MIKKILLILAGLVVAFILIGFVLPSKLEVSKSVTIHAPASAVFEEINDLTHWEQWNYWNTLDPEMKINYGEKKAGTGATYSWDGPEMGQGSITITESVADRSVALDLNFMENGVAKAFYSVAPDGDNTQLTFNFSADQGMNPIARWFNVFMKGEIEKSFVYGGDKIKTIAEAKPVFHFELSEVIAPPVSYVGLTHTMSPKDGAAISAQMGKMYSTLDAALKKAKVSIAGMPFCIYPEFSEESMKMICALPVAADAKTPAAYPVLKMDGGRAVKGIYRGDYNNLQAIHTEIQKYIRYKKLTESGAPWEVYVTDPMTEKDPAKWITEVYYPVSGN
jgi:effector-binding domain-containing protein